MPLFSIGDRVVPSDTDQYGTLKTRYQKNHKMIIDENTEFVVFGFEDNLVNIHVIGGGVTQNLLVHPFRVKLWGPKLTKEQLICLKASKLWQRQVEKGIVHA